MGDDELDLTLVRRVQAGDNAAFDLLPKEIIDVVSGNPKQMAAKPLQFDGGWWGDNLDAVQEKLDNWRQS